MRTMHACMGEPLQAISAIETFHYINVAVASLMRLKDHSRKNCIAGTRTNVK